MKKVTTLLGATLTKEEVDEFMREADVVSDVMSRTSYRLMNWILFEFLTGWKWQAGLWWICKNAFKILRNKYKYSIYGSFYHDQLYPLIVSRHFH